MVDRGTGFSFPGDLHLGQAFTDVPDQPVDFGAGAWLRRDAPDLSIGALAGTAGGSSTLIGDLERIAGVGVLAGTGEGGSSAVGDLTALLSLEGAAGGGSAASGNLTLVQIGDLAGAATGGASATGVLALIGTFAGALAGVADVQGDLQFVMPPPPVMIPDTGVRRLRTIFE